MTRFIRYIRLGLRVAAAFVATLFIHWFGVRLPQILGNTNQGHKGIGFWGGVLAKIMGVRVHMRNERPEPRGDLIVSNHMGFLDIPLMLSFFPAVFIIKMEARRVFYFGKALENQGHLFVDRNDKTSRRRIGLELFKRLQKNERIIVFPEGGASPGAKRPPFQSGSFSAAKKADKLVQLCVIDYLPNRKMLEWDVNRPVRPQLADLFGRHRTDISIEFFPAEKVEGTTQEIADRYHRIVEEKLEQYDREREERERA